MSVDADLMCALSLVLSIQSEQLHCLLGKFLIGLISTPNQFESFEIDNFVLKNSYFLTDWYEFLLPDVSRIFDFISQCLDILRRSLSRDGCYADFFVTQSCSDRLATV